MLVDINYVVINFGWTGMGGRAGMPLTKICDVSVKEQFAIIRQPLSVDPFCLAIALFTEELV